MRYLLLASIILFSLAGCESAEEKAQAQAVHDAKIIKQARADLMAELKVKADAKLKADALQNTKLSQVGISVKDKEITINPEKAKDFFNNIGKRLEERLLNLTKDLDKGMVEGTDTGVHINESKINIDLNKTQDFLRLWGEKMRSFVKEMDKVSSELVPQQNKTH